MKKVLYSTEDHIFGIGIMLWNVLFVSSITFPICEMPPSQRGISLYIPMQFENPPLIPMLRNGAAVQREHGGHTPNTEKLNGIKHLLWSPEGEVFLSVRQDGLVQDGNAGTVIP